MSNRLLLSCSRWTWLGFGTALLASSCSGNAPSSDDSGATPLPLVVPQISDATLGAHWQELASPSPATGSRVFDTPLGWFSISTRAFGNDGKAVSGYESYLYRSVDGVNWQLVSLPQGGAATESLDDDLLLADMTYADGKLVVVGRLSGATVLISRDGEHFKSVFDSQQTPLGFHAVTYAGERFFALGQSEAFTSLDGSQWERAELGDAFLPNGVAYGNSVFLIAGNGGLALSPDASAWERSEIDCALPGACVPDPGGRMHQILGNAWFSEGRFYSGRLSSSDGVTWEEAPAGPLSFARWGEYEVGYDSTDVVVWKPGSAPVHLDLESFPLDAHGSPINPGATGGDPIALILPAMPETASFPLASGQDCTASPCIVLNGRLYIAQ